MLTRGDLEFDLADQLSDIQVTVAIIGIALYLAYNTIDMENKTTYNVLTGVVASSSVLFLVSAFKYQRTKRMIKKMS